MEKKVNRRFRLEMPLGGPPNVPSDWTAQYMEYSVVAMNYPRSAGAFADVSRN